MNIDKLLKDLTLEEKASLMSGQNFWNTKSINRLGIPSMILTDGPHGLRKQGGSADHLGLNASIPATCFPTAATLANSWDEELLYEVGQLLGREAAVENVGVLLGPGLNIKRNPLCGRNFEYFSEDPFLSGMLASKMIEGIQSNGIGACPKHFAINSQEHHRMIIDEIVDKRAMHEIYLEAFRYCVKSSPKVMMTSYNKINGVYANEHPYVLNETLLKKWNFQGIVVTDWGGNNNRIEGLIAGNHLEMPASGGFSDQEIVDAVRNGEIDEKLLDERVKTYLQVLSDVTSNKEICVDFDKQHLKAQEAASKSIVLLKNDNILPLKGSKKVSVIGDFAKNPRYQGAGSSLINPTRIDNSLVPLLKTDLSIVGYERGFKRLGGKSEILKRRAIKLANKSDIILLYLGLDEASESEGIDREHLRIRENQLELVKALKGLGKKIVVILSGGAPIEIPFINDVDAIVHGYLFGQAGANAMTDVLVGNINPSGKLAETYPVKCEDIPSFNYYPGSEVNSQHRESIFVGYRYFDTVNKDVLFPFGYGLSYTNFEYSKISLTNKYVEFYIKNTGDVYGEEIAQVYIEAINSNVFRAKKELKGFSKVGLLPSEEKKIRIVFNEHTFSYFNIDVDDWVVESCEYLVHIGKNIRDIVLTDKINISGENLESPYEYNKYSKYYKAEVHNITKDDFESILGFEIEMEKWDRNRKLKLNDILEQIKYTNMFGKIIFGFIMFIRKLLFKLKRPILANYILFGTNTTFKQMYRYSNGKINEEMMLGIIEMFNSGFIKGLRKYMVAKREYKKRRKNLKLDK